MQTFNHMCLQPQPQHTCTGAGGLQFGYFLMRAGRSFHIFERNMTAAVFYSKYPRHRRLISINKPYTGRGGREVNLRHNWHTLLADEDDPNEIPSFHNFSMEYYPPADTLHRSQCRTVSAPAPPSLCSGHLLHILLPPFHERPGDHT